MADQLYPYQRSGAAFLAGRRVGFLCDEPGLGKSCQAIAAADLIRAKRILAITTAIARETLMREFLQWQTIPRTIKVVNSKLDARDIDDADVVLSSFSLAPFIEPTCLFDLLILDEAQALKSPTTARTKAVYGKNGLITKTRRAWLLSGTLCPNYPSELWTHLRALLPHTLDKIGLEYVAFINRFCHTEQTVFGTRVTDAKQERIAELAALIAPHYLQRRLVDAQPELPPLRWGHTVVAPERVPPREPAPTPEEQAIISSLLNRIDAGGDTSLSVAERMHLATLRRWTGVSKAPAVVELINNMLGGGVDKIVVFALHHEVLNIIANGIPGSAVIQGGTSQVTRQQLIDAFQRDEQPRILVLQMMTGGTALTLHRASHVLFAEISWSPADNYQAAKRCHRIGQTRPVLAQIVSLAQSIDETVAAVVLSKTSALAELDKHLAEKAA